MNESSWSEGSRRTTGLTALLKANSIHANGIRAVGPLEGETEETLTGTTNLFHITSWNQMWLEPIMWVGIMDPDEFLIPVLVEPGGGCDSI